MTKVINIFSKKPVEADPVLKTFLAAQVNKKKILETRRPY
jgi:hypothetical protein